MTDWDKRFIDLAKHVAQWSKDPSTKVGAVIVDPKTKKVVSMGYNGFPRGVVDSDERYNNREEKLSYIVHAEVNAVLNAGIPLNGYHIYVWPTMMIPNSCPECSKVIAQSGISMICCEEVNDLPERWQKLAKYSENILYEAGVKIKTI